jgi:ABC-type Na+ transport system ATPase subunit NatA
VTQSLHASTGDLATTPVLVANAVRIHLDGAVAVRALDLETRGDRILWLGGAAPIVAALAGVRPRPENPHAEPLVAAVQAGSLTVLGHDVATHQHRRVLGVALADPPLPARSTVAAYVTSCARLDGASRRAANALTDAALTTLSLGGIARSRLGRLSTLERRVVVLASAIVSQPRAVLIDEPLTGLDEREAPLMLGAIGHAVAGRAAIVTATQLRLGQATGELATNATDICLFRSGNLVMQGDPIALLKGGRVYEVTVTGRGAELIGELGRRGLTLHGGPHHFSIALPEREGTRVLFEAARDVAAPVTRCMPLLG